MFRALKPQEMETFTEQVSFLADWCSLASSSLASAPPGELEKAVASVLQQLTLAYGSITSHSSDTKTNKNKRALATLLRSIPPPDNAGFQPHMRKIQEMSDSLNEDTKRKAVLALHRSMILGTSLKCSVSAALQRPEHQPMMVRDPNNPSLTLNSPKDVAQAFAHTLQRLGGDPDYHPHTSFVSKVLAHTPQCASAARDTPVSHTEMKDYTTFLHHAKPTKAGGDHHSSSYILNISREPVTRFFWIVTNIYLHRELRPTWLTARVCVLYKRGDQLNPIKYRPIVLLNTSYKTISAHTARHLQNQALQHRVLLSIQHGRLRQHQCSDHILHVKAKYANVKGSYALYIDFDKAFNSVPHRQLFQVLEHNGFSRTAVDIIKLLSSAPLDARINNGQTPVRYFQRRGVGQGCPLSPLLCILYLNALLAHFMATHPPPPNKTSTQHVFVDDILIQSEDPEYSQSALNFFNHDAKVWGLDMNVSETEVQAVGNSRQRDFFTTPNNMFSTINPDTGRPRNFCKYPRVYFYTQDQSEQLTSALRATIRADFANIDPLALTLSEKVRLLNKQLHPMIAYRLLGHCLPVQPLNLYEKDIRRALQGSSITPNVSPMDRPHPRSQGGLDISSLPIMVHVQIVNSAIRCLTRVAPAAIAEMVTASLFSHTPDPLQDMILDSAHFLQLSYHSMAVWRNTPVQHLQTGETLVVHYRKHGKRVGRVSSATSKTATLEFHDGTATMNKETNFTSHFLVHTYHPYPSLPHQILSPTFVHPQQLIPDAPFSPDDGINLDTTIHGPLLLVPVAHSLSEFDLTNWGSTAPAALTQDSDANTVWVYSDRSSANVGHAAALTIFLPGRRT